MKKFDEYLLQALKGYAAELSPEIARYQALVGANDTVEKAEVHLREAIQREHKAAEKLEQSNSQAKEILRAAQDTADKIQARTVDDNNAAHRLRAETQALKDQATRELAEQGKKLQALKVELDQRSADLDRRDTVCRELETKLNERQRKFNAAIA